MPQNHSNNKQQQKVYLLKRRDDEEQPWKAAALDGARNIRFMLCGTVYTTCLLLTHNYWLYKPKLISE